MTGERADLSAARYFVHVDGLTFWVWDIVDECDARLSSGEKRDVVRKIKPNCWHDGWKHG